MFSRWLYLAFIIVAFSVAFVSPFQHMAHKKIDTVRKAIAKQFIMNTQHYHKRQHRRKPRVWEPQQNFYNGHFNINVPIGNRIAHLNGNLPPLRSFLLFRDVDSSGNIGSVRTAIKG